MRVRQTTRTLALAVAVSVAWVTPGGTAATFDHDYRRYGELLAAHVRDALVDYPGLVAEAAELSAVVAEFAAVSESEYDAWTRNQQLSYWINAYNAFTLKAIVDHYPIEGSWFSLHPSDSIRQIDGVWDELTWAAAGRSVTLDDIEHGILRPTFEEPRIHFAINCASISCPPLASRPYVAADLDDRLDVASRTFLASDQGVRIDGSTLRVTSILDWYGEDFIERYAGVTSASGSPKERAILGVVARFGVPEAARLARSGDARIRYLSYDWSLNDASK